jgi:hypothetical protein
MGFEAMNRRGFRFLFFVLVEDPFKSGAVAALYFHLNGLRRFLLWLSVFGFEYTADPATPESVWEKTLCTTSRCVIKGLTPGKKYWFRAFVTGTKGQQITGEMLISPFVQ